MATFAAPDGPTVPPVQVVVPTGADEMVHVGEPVGVAPLAGPVTVAVKTRLPPVDTGLLLTLSTGVALATVTVSLAEVTVL